MKPPGSQTAYNTASRPIVSRQTHFLLSGHVDGPGSLIITQ